MTERKRNSGILKTLLLSVILLLYIFPFFLVLINAFKTKIDVIKKPLSLICLLYTSRCV